MIAEMQIRNYSPRTIRSYVSSLIQVFHYYQLSPEHISLEQFKDNEQREMHSDDPDNQNLSKCIEMADFVLTNDGSIDDLHMQIEGLIKKLNMF